MASDELMNVARHPPRSPLRKLVLNSYMAAGLLFALATCSALAYMRFWCVRRDNAFESIRATGAPVFVADMIAADHSDPRTSAWLREAEELPDIHLLLVAGYARDFRGRIAKASDAASAERREQLDAYEREIVERVRVARAERATDGSVPSTAEPTGTAREFALEQRIWLDVQVAASATHCAHAERARGLAPISAAMLAARRPEIAYWWLRTDTPIRVQQIATALTIRAHARALTGDVRGASDDAQRILDVAHLFTTPLASHDVVAVALAYIDHLQAVENTVRLAPTGDIENELPPEITTRPLIAALECGVRGERARLNERSARGPRRAEDHDIWTLIRHGVEAQLFHVRGQVAMLDAYERILPALVLTRRDRTTIDWSGPPARDEAFVEYPDLGFWRLKRTFDWIDEVEARIALVHFARLARAGSVNLAVDAARSAVDPFSDRPYRFEHARGRLRIWSVGRDGHDDGGVTARPGSYWEGDLVLEWREP